MPMNVYQTPLYHNLSSKKKVTSLGSSGGFKTHYKATHYGFYINIFCVLLLLFELLAIISNTKDFRHKD